MYWHFHEQTRSNKTDQISTQTDKTDYKHNKNHYVHRQ